jgi:hypothetical protein
MFLQGIPSGALCRLLSTTGQELMRWTRTFASQEEIEIISLKDFPQGAYLLAIEANGTRTVKTILHQ